MKYQVDEHIKKSVERLCSAEYGIDQIFQSDEYSWPGDWEGRVLLALCCLHAVADIQANTVHELVAEFPKHCNGEGFMGKRFNPACIDEQQLSGHSWVLRGLVAYYQQFHDEQALAMADTIVQNLYLRARQYDKHYPVTRRTAGGGVSGERADIVQGWRLSTDVGCAFMCLDGLSAYYEVRPTLQVRSMLDEWIGQFAKLDFVGLRVQTHATLSATRGIIKMYQCTKDPLYLRLAIQIFQTYVENGMTLTYENYNWFGREDSWTEPCAVVDSFIISIQLFEITKDNKYLTLLRRIWFNGLSYCHRANGGAGPNTCVTQAQPILQTYMYEAKFCCTMRYCEGLLFAKRYETLLCRRDSPIVKDERGRRFCGDALCVKDDNGNTVALPDLAFGGQDGKTFVVLYQ